MDIVIWLLCGIIGGVLGATIVILCQSAYEKRIARRLMARWDEDLIDRDEQ